MSLHFSPKRTPFLALVALLSLTALTALTACSGGGEAGQDQAAADHQPPADAVPGGNVGNLAPDFDLKNIAGGTLKLSSLRGKAVIIDFWDTWCPPCRKALPALEAVSQAYPDDLVVLGVAFGREGEDKVRSFVKQQKLTFPMVMADPEFQVVRDYGNFQSIPTTFLVDRSGVIVKRWVGGHSREEYESAVKAVLGV